MTVQQEGDVQKTFYSGSVAVQGLERMPDAAARVDAHHHQAQLWYVRCPTLSPGSVAGVSPWQGTVF